MATPGETRIVRALEGIGWHAARARQRSESNEPDVWAGDFGKAYSAEAIPLLIWTRLAKLKEGQLRRRPDGEKTIVVLSLDNFVDLLALVPVNSIGLLIQEKSSQTVNATRTLGDLRAWIGRHLRGK